MLELIIESGFDIISRSERIAEAARRLVFRGGLDGREALAIYREAERLMETSFAMTDAIRLLRNCGGLVAS